MTQRDVTAPSFVPVALACGCVIEGFAQYDIDPGVRPPLVECANGHGWQEFVIEPEIADD
jgi:hypothetical protein